ncbi:monodechloroaminopyrrolnitrin synthase PrnB family protein [Priestia megaterium]
MSYNNIKDMSDNKLTLPSSVCDYLVSHLDPLELDDFFENEFCALNEQQDTTKMKDKLEKVLEKSSQTQSNTYDAMAITRDIGFIASALNRHGVDIHTITNLESELLRLSELTLELPRDNVNSYTTRNPKGKRQRTFTNYPEERLFIHSVRESMNCLYIISNNLQLLKETDICSSDYVRLVNNCSEQFNFMVNSIVQVKKEISPERFSFDLQPYFSPFVIGGKLYHGPGGTQMLMIIVEFLLYGSSLDNKEYQDYLDNNFVYLPYDHREIVISNKNKPSIIDLILLKESTYIERKERLYNSLNSLEKFLNRIIAFRSPHTQLAKDNMKVRPPKSLGSGGYNASILETLLEITLEKKRTIKEFKKTIELVNV